MVLFLGRRSLTGNIKVYGNMLVKNGATLLCGTFIVSGPGTFTIEAGGTLGDGDPAGITTSGATGNIQVTGTRTYTTGSSYIYNGSVNQAVGNGLPASVLNLTIANGGPGGNNTVTGNAGQTVTGLLRVQTGIYAGASTYNNVQIDSGATLVATAASTINVSGDWTNNGGTFTAGTRTVNFNSTSATQTIGGTAPTQTFNILTVNKSGQALTTGGSLATLNVATFNVNAGIFNQGTANVVSGPITVAAAGTYQNLSAQLRSPTPQPVKYFTRPIDSFVYRR